MISDFFELVWVRVSHCFVEFLQHFHFDLHFINDFITQAFSQEFANMLLGTNMVISADWNFFLTLIIAYIIASNEAASVIASSNMIYGIKNSSFLKRRLKSL